MSAIYTFRVNMIVHVFAETPEAARQFLDTQGGSMQRRDVELIATTDLPLSGAE